MGALVAFNLVAAVIVYFVVMGCLTAPKSSLGRGFIHFSGLCMASGKVNGKNKGAEGKSMEEEAQERFILFTLQC